MENPRVYSAANSLQRADAESIMREFSAELNIAEGARILDVGCGSGDVTAEILLPLLPKDVAQIIGVDLSESMVAHARKKHPLPHLAFLQLNIEEETDNLFQKLIVNLTFHNNNEEDKTDSELLPRRQSVEIFINDVKLEDFQDGAEMALEREMNKVSIGCANSEATLEKMKGEEFRIMKRKLIDNRFDVVFSFYCLHWIQNQRQALRNISSMLKPGGQVILALLAQSTIYTMYERISEMSKWCQYMQDVKKFISPYQSLKDPAENLKQLAEDIGLQVATVECRRRTFLYEKISDLLEAIKAVNPFCSRLPDHLVDEYLADCLKIVQNFNLAEFTNDGYNVHYSLLVAHLRK